MNKKKKNILDGAIELVDKFFNFYLKGVAIITLIFLGLIFAVEFNKIFSTDSIDGSDTTTMITAIFAITIALTAMAFTYANNFPDKKEEREKLLRIGEKFILSVVSLLLYLGIVGLGS